MPKIYQLARTARCCNFSSLSDFFNDLRIAETAKKIFNFLLAYMTHQQVSMFFDFREVA